MGTATGGAGNCAPGETLELLQAYIGELEGSAYLLAGHPSANEGVSFFAAPGLPSPPANAASFSSLVMPCSAPTTFDPYCDQGLCSQLECPDDTPSWINHLSLDSPPQTFGAFVFDQVNLDISWTDGASGIEFAASHTATGPSGGDWTLEGTGTMDGMSMTLDVQIPNLFPAGAATLTVTSTPSATASALVVNGVTIAEADASGHLAATGACP